MYRFWVLPGKTNNKNTEQYLIVNANSINNSLAHIACQKGIKSITFDKVSVQYDCPNTCVAMELSADNICAATIF